MEKTSDKIRELRISKKLTQQQLADQLHVTKQAISKWEKGKSIPDITSVELIAAFFGVSVDYLINDSIVAAKPYATVSSVKPSNYMNKLTVALISVLAVLLAAVISLSIALGMVVRNGKPDYSVEVHGLVFTYLSDKTQIDSESSANLELTFNVYNTGDDAVKLMRNSFTINNSQMYIKSMSPHDYYYEYEYTIAAHAEVNVVISLSSLRGYLRDIRKHSVTVKYAGQPLGTVWWL